MSTEGSVSTSSSGIRQFGLYRTIDARTEEFLRLSRKRQIRQGCACAAISTAVTVTIVISVVLIYEYTILNESTAKTSLKQNWLSLMNKSEEAIPFEAKLNKAKINLDPMYLQFLPLILKTLKKNKYIDEIIEEDATQIPLEDNPENLYTENIFSDTSNWMTMPTSRLFTIEYKTSPIVYFKYPTRNVEHFTKVRRIRDYQRVMSYIDKMISDRSFTSTVPVMKSTATYYKKTPLIIYPNTTPMSKVVEYTTNKRNRHKISLSPKKTSKIIKKKSDCRCPKRIGRLLSTLVRSLQKIIPDFMGGEQNLCNVKKNTVKSPSENNRHGSSTVNSKEKIILEKPNKHEFIDNIKTVNPYIMSTKTIPTTESLDIPTIHLTSNTDNDNDQTTMPISKTFYTVKPTNPKVDFTLSSMIKIIKPHIKEIQQENETMFFTTNRQFIEGTEADFYIPEQTTKSMPKVTPIITDELTGTLQTVREFVLEKERKFNKSLLTFPTFGESTTESKEYTTPGVVNNFKVQVLDVTSRDLPTTRKLIKIDRKKHNDKKKESRVFKTRPSHKPVFKNEKVYKNTWDILSKMGNLALTVSNNIQNSSDESNWNLSNSIETTTEKENKGLNVTSAMPVQKSAEKYSNSNKLERPINIDDVTFEEEKDDKKASSEDMNPEDSLRSLENLLSKINLSELFNSSLGEESDNEKSNLEKLRLTQIEKQPDLRFHSKSMIPKNRPSYLEIQRTDFNRNDVRNNHEPDDDYYNTMLLE